MSESIIVSIMPSYKCSRKCPYCYLSKETDKEDIIPLDILSEKLEEIKSSFPNLIIDLFGGEMDELPFKYLKDLLKLCKQFSNDICVTSGCINGNCFSATRDEKIKLAVSLNEERPDNRKTEEFLMNYKDCHKYLSISMVVLPSLLKKSPKQILDYLQEFNLPVTFFRYIKSTNSKNVYKISREKYERFIVDIYNFYIQHNKNPYEENPYTFEIINPSYKTIGNPFIPTSLFIDPCGNYCTVDYNEEGSEYFRTFENFQDWKSFNIKEFKQFFKTCSGCPIYGNCLCEHFSSSKFSSIRKCDGLPGLVSYLKALEYETNLHKDN